MARYFNTTGPNNVYDHYCIDPIARIDWPEVERLIDRKKYFAIYANTQTGKTSLLDAIVERLNSTDKYEALCISAEMAQPFCDDVEKVDTLIARRLVKGAELPSFESWLASEGLEFVSECEPGSILNELLSEWACNGERPTVLLIDEIDSLAGDALMSILRQLRDGYKYRPTAFPQSVIFCSRRDLRRCHTCDASDLTTTGLGVFDFIAESIGLRNFSEREVRQLYGQHTAETGQVFEHTVFPRVMSLTGGQPWLVNALACILTEKTPELKDRARNIGLYDVEMAKEQLIRSRDCHLLEVARWIEDERVRKVIVPILIGDDLGAYASSDDTRYVADLGLIELQPFKAPRIANGIYLDVILRELISVVESDIAPLISCRNFLLLDGSLNCPEIMSMFQQFYRRNSETWSKRVVYNEAAPELLFLAWLRNIVGTAGTIDCECAASTRRVNFFTRYFRQKDGKHEEQRFTVEIQSIRDNELPEKVVFDGTKHTAAYARARDAAEAHLVVIDSRKDQSWDQKLFCEEQNADDQTVTVWGM